MPSVLERSASADGLVQNISATMFKVPRPQHNNTMFAIDPH